MLRRCAFGAAILSASFVTACVPTPVRLLPPQSVRVERSYECVEPAATTATDPDRCVFWRDGLGQTFFGPFAMVHPPPEGSDIVIPPPIVP